MELRRPDTLAQFLDAASPFLMRHEAEHGLMLGVAASTTSPPRDAYWALVVDGTGVVAAALRTADKLIVSREGAAGAMAALARDATGPEIKALSGPVASVAAFAAASGRRWCGGMDQRIYELRAVTPPRAVPGRRRVAGPPDHALLAEWVRTFRVEASGEVLPPEAAAVAAAHLIMAGALHVWEDGGRPVSTAAAVQPTPRGIRVNTVYTPPELRGRGYATALVASLSQHLLDSGRAFVFLYTDLANPTSNRIYQRIGYRPVGEACVVWLEAPPSAAANDPRTGATA